MARGKAAAPGDTYVAANGYHYTRGELKWELTHRLVMEEHLGRSIKDTERIKFIDGDKTNIKLENLRIDVVSGNKSKEAKIANLRAKIQDLTLELEALEQS